MNILIQNLLRAALVAGAGWLAAHGVNMSDANWPSMAAAVIVTVLTTWWGHVHSKKLLMTAPPEK